MTMSNLSVLHAIAQFASAIKQLHRAWKSPRRAMSMTKFTLHSYNKECQCDMTMKKINRALRIENIDKKKNANCQSGNFLIGFLCPIENDKLD